MRLRDYLDQAPRGTGTELAAKIGVNRVLVSQWTAEEGARQVPAEHCPAIERATNGAVRCEDLRPDIDWAVLRKKRHKSPPAPATEAAQ